MNKDEILSRSRHENAGQDERELQIRMKAGNIAKAVGGLICGIIVLLEALLSDGTTFVGIACWTMYAGMTAVEDVLLAVQLKKKGHWLSAVFWMLIFAVMGILLVMRLAGR